MIGTEVKTLSPDLAAFYTAKKVGELLVSLLSPLNPSSIVDLGAGTGVLARAAWNRWQRASVVTVDVDSSIQPEIASADIRCNIHNHFNADVFDHDLPFRLKSCVPTPAFDVAVCNPPYTVPEWRESFCHILNEAKLLGGLASRRDLTSEIIFIAQNLRLLRAGGQIGIIVPDNLIAGSKMESFRRLLMSQYRIETVMQLPVNVFQRAEASAYLLILSKSDPCCRQITLEKLMGPNCTAPPIKISSQEGMRRLDYDFHAVKRSCPTSRSSRTFTLSEIGAKLIVEAFPLSNGRIFCIQYFISQIFLK